jgi:hypothetical protein
VVDRERFEVPTSAEQAKGWPEITRSFTGALTAVPWQDS